jgi:DNA helicase IV
VDQTKTDLSNLNDKQREAVVSEDKRLLVLAGAGSGKTKTLLQKLIYLIEEKGISLQIFLLSHSQRMQLTK